MFFVSISNMYENSNYFNWYFKYSMYEIRNNTIFIMNILDLRLFILFENDFKHFDTIKHFSDLGNSIQRI
jgi:hypothetical protein